MEKLEDILYVRIKDFEKGCWDGTIGNRNSGKEVQTRPILLGSQISRRGKMKLKLYSVIHLVVCLTTGSKPLPKRALHIVRSTASSFK